MTIEELFQNMNRVVMTLIITGSARSPAQPQEVYKHVAPIWMDVVIYKFHNVVQVIYLTSQCMSIVCHWKTQKKKKEKKIRKWKYIMTE